MAKITYLLGAGASYQAVPIVSKMSERMTDTVAWLNNLYSQHGILSRFSTRHQEKFNDVLSDLNWLGDLCDTNRNFSIDTYARKLKISGRDEEYVKLKNILSFFFTIQQRKNPPDVRYDNFWASILKEKTKFPDNIRIISWNYDFQLELTYKDFLGVDSLADAREKLHVTSLETPINHISLDFPHLFGVFKLNGSASFTNNQNASTSYFIDNFNGKEIKDFIIIAVEAYEKMSTNKSYLNHLSFAWEHDFNNPFYKNLEKSVRDTEILVVIGYSFPFFNREVDKRIFRQFMGGSLRKVYFQAPEQDVNDVRERFLAINDMVDAEKLILRKDIRQFTLPNEL